MRLAQAALVAAVLLVDEADVELAAEILGTRRMHTEGSTEYVAPRYASVSAYTAIRLMEPVSVPG